VIPSPLLKAADGLLLVHYKNYKGGREATASRPPFSQCMLIYYLYKSLPPPYGQLPAWGCLKKQDFQIFLFSGKPQTSLLLRIHSISGLRIGKS
jgi:hypothetical protein